MRANDVVLMNEIKDWINFILRTAMAKGETATYIKEQGVPCPKCGEKKAWENA